MQLPVVQSVTRERADAARNRERILTAARELVTARGIDGVSMDDVALAAGVGTGTLYRRFGDRAGLAIALLDEQTRALQDAWIAGPPPLGPGAAPRRRLVAFADGYLALLEQHAELMAVADGADAPGPRAAMLLHLTFLLEQLDDGLDAPATAELLLAALEPGTFLRLRRGLGWPRERIAEAWRALLPH